MGVVRLDRPYNDIAFHALEVPGSPTHIANQLLPIMPGSYELTKHTGSSNPNLNGKPRLSGSGLSPSRGILMHGGTNSGHSEGCILYGMPAGWGKLNQSGFVWTTILKPWLDACNWQAKIHISG